ncbi:MAG: SUMF1/EgtB/PvdO family nonheme iron enzyme [Planctomycetota bacterium]
MASTCPKCGKENEPGRRFCGSCGFDMSSGETIDTPFDPTLTSAPSAAPKDPLIGQEVGGCVIESKIGQGGMGAVYSGTQKSLDRKVAIKILPSHLAENATYITRFLREAQIVASLKHPNIVSVIDRGQAGDMYFFIMEYITGRTVSQAVMEQGRVSPGDALEITRQAALALATAAEEGIIHRDIKPDNIMMEKGGVVKVTDFGLVKNTMETSGGITAPQQVMGTPAFMSPEQCEGDEVDHRSDIYSLGMTLYTMLSGSPAFTATTPLALLRKHLDEQPAPVYDRNPDVPKSVWPVLKKMLAKKPDERYADWDAVLEALDSLRDKNRKEFETTSLLHRKGAGRMPSSAQRASAPTLKEAPAALKKASEAETLLSPSRTGKASTGKKKIPAIVALVAAVIVIFLVTAFAWPGFLKKKETAASTPPVSTAGPNETAAPEVKKPKTGTMPEKEKVGEPEVPEKETEKEKPEPPEKEKPAPSKELTNSVGMKFVLVPAGRFNMGSPGTEAGRGTDENAHSVKITAAFYMQAAEVTQAQWKAVMGENPSESQGDDLPVENVSWHDAQTFIRKLSEKEGKDYRLPTEAEWEYACRASSSSPFYFGEAVTTDQVNYNGEKPYGPAGQGDNREKPTPAGSLGKNKWGLSDMHGNVWEWCADWYEKDYYKNSPAEDPQGPGGGKFRVARGGSFFTGGRECRSAKRRFCVPKHKTRDIGFRVCLPINER